MDRNAHFGALKRVIVYECILSYSRRLFYWASLDETQPSIYEAQEEAFWHFGGVPKTILVDNAKAFVLNAHPERFAWNPTFLELCGYYCVEPRACAPRRTRTKGKCERSVSGPLPSWRTISSRGTSGRISCTSAESSRASPQRCWIPASITRPTRLRWSSFAEELPHLTPLPATRYVGIHALTRKVSWDCMIAYDGSRYSVPYAYAGKRVWLRVSQGQRLEILSPTGAALAMHDLSPTKGATIIEPTHYEGLRKDTPRSKVVLVEAFQARFPAAQQFLEGVLTQYKTNPVRYLRGVLELARQYPADAMRAAFGIPSVVTTAPSDGGARVPPEIAASLGEMPHYVRTTTDAFLHAPTRDAIIGTGRKTLLIAGVATEIIVQHSALSGAAHGFDVQVVIDACGGLSPRTEDAALRRLTQAGVITTSVASIAGQLAGDFTQPVGGKAVSVLYEMASG